MKLLRLQRQRDWLLRAKRLRRVLSNLIQMSQRVLKIRIRLIKRQLANSRKIQKIKLTWMKIKSLQKCQKLFKMRLRLNLSKL